MHVPSIKTFLRPEKEEDKPFALQQRARTRMSRNFAYGRLVLHKRKPLRDPVTAQMMALYRARGMYAPGNRGARAKSGTYN